MHQKCVDQQTPPRLKSGDILHQGQFFRNLKKNHVAKRYEGDDDGNPRYGFKLTRKHWKNADQQQGHLSMNLVSCMHSEACSIALQPGGEEYYHVATIDLEALNSSEQINSPFVAQYKPSLGLQNLCHFELFPENGTVLPWLEFGALLDTPFPPAKKMPSKEQEQREASLKHEKYRSIFAIRRWVRHKDGTLPLPQ